MNLVVNDQESVVMAMRELDILNRWILLVMLLEVGEELLAVAGMDGGCNAFSALGDADCRFGCRPYSI